MNKKLTALLISILAIVAGIVYLKKRGKNEKCCETCPSSQDKYYFEDNNMCIEACISPTRLDKILKIQPDFKKVENNKGCISLGYTMYDHTETKQGENGNVLNVDFYKKP